jgi:TonB family protein
MFEVLLESRGVRPPRPMISSALSVAAHAALAVGSVTSAHFLFDSERTPRDLEVLTEMVRYLVPPEREAAPYSDRLRYSTAAGGSTAAGIMEGHTRNISENGLIGTGAPGQNTANESSEAPIATPSRSVEAFTVIEVDSAAIRDPDSASPDYPKALIEKGIEGYAAMRFVVDSTGRIDMNTVQVIDATHNDFAKAVRDVMPRMHFRPARIGRSAVRQLAEQVFKFEIKIATAATPSSGKKPSGSAIPER